MHWVITASQDEINAPLTSRTHPSKVEIVDAEQRGMRLPCFVFVSLADRLA